MSSYVELVMYSINNLFPGERQTLGCANLSSYIYTAALSALIARIIIIKANLLYEWAMLKSIAPTRVITEFNEIKNKSLVHIDGSKGQKRFSIKMHFKPVTHSLAHTPHTLTQRPRNSYICVYTRRRQVLQSGLSAHKWPDYALDSSLSGRCGTATFPRRTSRRRLAVVAVGNLAPPATTSCPDNVG